MKTRAELDAEVAKRAGCIELRRSRFTRTLVGLYRSAEAGMEVDPETPYSTVCEDHGSIVCHATLKNARSWIADPSGWCDECRDNLEKKS